MCRKHLFEGGFLLLGKFEWNFTLKAFTQEMERGIDFGLLKRVNGTHSMSISNNGQVTFSLTGRRFYMFNNYLV